jgi:hypothetical protein
MVASCLHGTDSRSQCHGMNGWLRHRSEAGRRGGTGSIPVLLLLAALCGAASCGTDTRRMAPPDMTEIRGDPIEGPAVVENGVSEPVKVEEIESVPAVDWLADGAANEPVMVSFDQLASFDYGRPEPPVEGLEEVPGEEDRIPAWIRALDGRWVGVKGFMLPTRLEGGLTTEFLLMRDQSMCCFGVIPQINEWVEVIMEGRGVRPLMDQPVTVFGRMRVGATYENGVLVGIYRMAGEDLAGPLDL